MLKRDLLWLWTAIAAMVLLLVWLLLQLGRQGADWQISAARSRAAVLCQIMRAGGERYSGDPCDRGDRECVPRRLVDGLVAEHRRHGDDLDVGIAVREQHRHRIVMAGIAVENDLRRHASTVSGLAAETYMKIAFIYVWWLHD